MVRDITIGQYYKTDSTVHALDPRMKIVAVLVYVISLFVMSDLWALIIAGLFLGMIVKVSHVPVRFLLRGLKPIFLLLVCTGIIHIFCTPGDIVWQWGSVHITLQGIQKCILVVVWLVLMMLGASMLTLTTTPNQLTDGLERLLHPLKKIGVPVHELAMIMSIALRFIPILVEELNKIMKAQMARGANFEQGNLFRRAKSIVPILVPLFVSAMGRANDLAYAMDARCYNGGTGRTKLHPLRYGKTDIAGYIVMFAYGLILWGVSKI